jgi:ribulose 1,5-bisphosphate synthetase/thiazole synthase
VKLAAVILVGVGTVGLVASYVLMRRRLEQLRRTREEGER